MPLKQKGSSQEVRIHRWRTGRLDSNQIPATEKKKKQQSEFMKLSERQDTFEPHESMIIWV